jgi:hypothetical protein
LTANRFRHQASASLSWWPTDQSVGHQDSEQTLLMPNQPVGQPWREWTNPPDASPTGQSAIKRVNKPFWCPNNHQESE